MIRKGMWDGPLILLAAVLTALAFAASWGTASWGT